MADLLSKASWEQAISEELTKLQAARGTPNSPPGRSP